MKLEEGEFIVEAIESLPLTEIYGKQWKNCGLNWYTKGKRYKAKNHHNLEHLFMISGIDHPDYHDSWACLSKDSFKIVSQEKEKYLVVAGVFVEYFDSYELAKIFASGNEYDIYKLFAKATPVRTYEFEEV